MTTLKSAAELAAPAAGKPYPNDSPAYRAARVALLEQEILLRRQIEAIAAQRRALPDGGAAADYAFTDQDGNTVALADLFGAHDTLVTYFWMYGPQRARPCPMCTAFLGALDVPSADLAFYATVGDDFARDYRGLAPNGDEWPALDVWTRRARSHAAVEYPRPDAGRAGHALVSEAGVLKQRAKD